MTSGHLGPSSPDRLLAAFDQHRRLLFTVAYTMLGSAADAEDVVQDTWLRWSADDRESVADDKAYLVRIASRLALNRLRSARARRESYVGPWLPEPLLSAGVEPRLPAAGADPAATAELAESVSLAMLVVLESLSPLERAVFVLHEVFGVEYAEVAAALGRTEAGVRQLAHRAREHVAARRPRFDSDRRQQREVTERFLAACNDGDYERLLAVLSPTVTLMSDGGGKAKAALRVLAGADKVARFLIAVFSVDTAELPARRFELVDINGEPGVALWSGDVPVAVGQLQLVGGRVEQVLGVLNPDKLARLVALGGRQR